MTTVADAVRAAAAVLVPFDVIDLSAANLGEIDFGRARADGVVACYFRGTKGCVTKASDTDGRVHEFANLARNAGMPFGIYSLGFARHNALQDSAQQARDAVRLSHELGATLTVAQDWEREKGDALVNEYEFLDAIRGWTDEAEREQGGTPPLMYCGPGWWSLSKLRLKATDLNRCLLWSSDFERSREIGHPLATPPFDKLAMHQYGGSPTPTGRITFCDGVGKGPYAYVDRSRLLMPLGRLML